MSQQPLRGTTATIDIYVRLAQYPILADKIRDRMRMELFSRGIVNAEQFEQEVRDLSIDSQRREGLGDPFFEEDAQSWQIRQQRIRDFHTDAYFANNLGRSWLDVIINEILDNQSATPQTSIISFNPEIAPWELLFRQGEKYERMTPDHLEQHAHHLEEIKVVLIKRLLSDQLPFIGVAKRVFTIQDLRHIHESLIGTGKIGGKAAGTLLAWRILHPLEESYGDGTINIPDSFFIGTDIIYEFLLMNRLEDYMNQKYLPIDEIRAEYPRLVEAFVAAKLPEYIVDRIRELVLTMGNAPLVVRSSSLLEDNFDFSFVSKYNSFYCPNQGTPEENLDCVLEAIRRVYASSMNPDAILYRHKHNLIDYDERMAILIQRVTGKFRDDYYFPDIAGVGFSQNPFCWSPEIRCEEGFLRIVTGMGLRAVDRISQDYPRLIPLSHPLLRPEDSLEGRRIFAQRLMSVIDRNHKAGYRTIPVREIAPHLDAVLPLIGSIDRGETIEPFSPDYQLQPDDKIVITFDGLGQDQNFVQFMRDVLRKLETAYQRPIDLEFAINIEFNDTYPPDSTISGEALPITPHYQLVILECRPLLKRQLPTVVINPADYDHKRQLFNLPTLLPANIIHDIDYLIFVDPDRYYEIQDKNTRTDIGKVLANLNDYLPAGRFAMIGPGRWGSKDNHLSVPVTYSDICNSKLLIEISPPYNPAPELAYGTDFYEDLIEAGISILGLQPPADGSGFDWTFLRTSPNHRKQYILDDTAAADFVRVIDLRATVGGGLKVFIHSSENRAIGVLE